VSKNPIGILRYAAAGDAGTGMGVLYRTCYVYGTRTEFLPMLGRDQFQVMGEDGNWTNADPRDLTTGVLYEAPKGSAWDLVVKRLATGGDMRTNGRNTRFTLLARKIPGGLILIALDREGGTVKSVQTGKCYDFWETRERYPAYDNPITPEEKLETIPYVKIVEAR
jgi:hypothetical protein